VPSLRCGEPPESQATERRWAGSVARDVTSEDLASGGDVGMWRGGQL
jgi:hypothetical protein